ncbi:glucoamylase family protein [Oscillospiraceae bacterium PP1C4]
MNNINFTQLENKVQEIYYKAKEQRGGMRRLIRSLQGGLDLLRERYEALREKPVLDSWEQWLADNFYVLEGHAKQALIDLRSYKKGGAPLFRFYWTLDGVFAYGHTPLSEEAVKVVLRAVNALEELTERQFDFVYCALKCSLLFAAADACGGEHTLEKREQLISYAVIGLSAIYELDFEEMTRQCSVVEKILSEDPSGVYPRMTEQSRRHYRFVVARIAKRCGISESTVARDVLDCAEKATGERESHVGYYLLRHDPQTIAAKKRGIAALTAAYLLPAVVCLLLWIGHYSVAVTLLAYLPLVEIVRVFASDFALRGVPASHIPRMELNNDVPKTVVAVSTLLPNASNAGELRTRLEQLYFSNCSKNLYFCVLADFKEDRRPYNPQDDLNIAASQKVIERLNKQYGSHFMLFVRRRTYNKTQNAYSGWERKRGAITEFIRFIKGGETSLMCFIGDRSVLPDLRYLIALDSDTNLSFESANLLVSAAAHPLNRPVIGKHNIVTAGYGILVPRMETDLNAAKATDFTRIMVGAGGVSTYEQECCDFYQDLFGEAIFAGKGLIDIDAFHTVAGRRFPENTVLSHDILEGAFLRVGLVSDVEMTDGIPTSALSWFSRLHRWLRGDWQNVRFLGKDYVINGVKRLNPINGLSRYKLIDNLRRSLIPVIAMTCVMVSCFTDKNVSLFLCLLAFFSVSLAPLLAGIRSLISGGRFALTRRFFARTLPRVFELFGQAILSIVMTAQQAALTIDAIVRTMWRMLVSKKNLLQWTTAAQGELRQVAFFAALKRSWISELTGLLILIFAPRSYLLVKLFGALFLLYVPIAVATSRATPDLKNLPSRAQREKLLSWCAQMFHYYEDFANEENHYLPPDNVQMSPRDAVARRTSPTNIGMMLLAILSARDFHFIDSGGLNLRLSRVFDTIDKLETDCGNLYNWYATDDLRVLPDNFVSAVDSGNYLCSLVALKEGLYEYTPQEPALRQVIERIDRILKTTDLSILYNKKRKLFSIGIDNNGVMSRSHYDFLMSEARTTGYYAIATRQAQYKHWRALNRTMSRSGVYAGPVSWTGTMFEYFMPHLLLPVYDGSLLGEALHYALYCQKKRAHHAGVPWGISESGYFAFDEHLNYQYKAHGIQELGVKRGLDRECVVSPYSTFLALSFDLDGSMKNLKRLDELGMVGQYGFYEAIDFTRSRCSVGGAVVRSYMAHHVGMSMIACANALFDNVMQKRFMRNHAMCAAREFLQEKISKDTVVYDQMKTENDMRRQAAPKEMTVVHENVSPLAPACAMLSNGSLTHVFADTGMSWLRFSDSDVTRRSFDPLAHAQGILAVVRMCGETISATAAPFYQKAAEHRCEFSSGSVVYQARKGAVTISQKFTIDRAQPVESCTLTIRNDSSLKAVAEILFYLEPVLSRQSEYTAHPAFAKLFLTGGRDTATDTITFSRRHRDGTDGLYLSIGFDRHYEYHFALKREDVTPYPEGLDSLLNFDTLPFEGGTATPDGCCALRLTTLVPARGENSVTLLISTAATLQESVGNLVAARERKPEPAFSPLMNDSMTGRLGMHLLSRLLINAPDSTENLQALAENTRGQDALWSLRISGELPIVLYDWQLQPDAACLESYAAFWTLMRLHQLEFDLCVLIEGKTPVKLPDGVRVIDPAKTDASALTALRAAACHIAGTTALPAPPEYQPATILHVEPAEILQGTDRFDVVGGAYVEGRFYVDRVTTLPFSHILSNPTFGTLLNDASLGNSWWINSRECKLSPWSNDIATGNDGERLLLAVGGEIYDLCRGARASFSPDGAWYDAFVGSIRTHVSVTVSKAGSCKYIDVSLENQNDEEVEIICAYYLEPVLGVSSLTSKYVQFEQKNDCLVMQNPYNTAVKCHAAIHVPREHPVYTTNRAAFLAGDWSASHLLPNNDPIAGTVVHKKLPPARSGRIRFILSAAQTCESATLIATMPETENSNPARTIEISTPDIPLNCFMNTFAPHQILAGRMHGRCAFYQCSGAYGFRDQLQDAGAYLLLDPAITKEQILRCCTVQFEEGDVLHWWHELPHMTRGVRTTFSDDLLWLPYIVCDYVKATGDTEILDLKIRYCKGDLLAQGEQERYVEVAPSEIKESVFEHCVRAIDHAHRLGDQGVPKIGCGDWNDGLSNVGVEGNGQSVWLGMFLAIVLDRFSFLCDERSDSYHASVFRGNAAMLRSNIDKNCWDGRWYLRAFYDDGTPIGSHTSDECQIDLLSQSFAVLAEMPDQTRVNTALDSTLKQLVDYDNRIVRLFAPSFEKSAHNPGYIKSYPTGIRENGGQYTHASVWLAIALLEAGRADEGWALLDMLNPTSRCTDAKLAQAFKTEPYYMPADIYTHSGAYGHGGWSIYTGAAAWYYRAVIETLLGIRFCGNHLELKPAIPSEWNGFSAKIKYDGCVTDIEVARTGEQALKVDGISTTQIPLDRKNHNVLLTL